jgi:hypothetical protein
MMNKILLIFTFTIFLLLQGCIASPKSSRNSGTSSSTTTTTVDPTFTSDQMLYWFSTTSTTGTITINKNSTNTYYLRGKYIHNFLKSYDSSGVYFYNKQYCLIGSYTSSSYKQLRVRAIPMSTTNSKTNVTERMLRLDFSNSTDNTSSCQKTTIDSTAAADAAYSISSICSSCTTSSATTSKIALYFNNTSASTLTAVSSSSLSTASVLLNIDFSSSSTSDASTCTTSACSAKGFDCCIDGQCVMDGAIKSSVDTTSTAYTQACSDVSSNPLSFINYPNVFYVCSDTTHYASATVNSGCSTTSSSSSTTTSTTSTATALAYATALERVSAYLQDWKCLEEYKSTTTYTNCRTYSSGTTENSTSRTATAYAAIVLKLAKACGCTASDSEVSTKCPNWSIAPVYKNSTEIDANITDFYCYTPSVTSQVGTITNSNISVSARSAPHRFYSTTGKNYDDLSAITKSTSTSIIQEGSDFYYLDELNKSGPQNVSNNANAVLGRMVVDLSKAAPAQQVTVDIGTSYIISATSGYFTPCPLCAKDSWFKSFFAHPASSKGVGLQYSGYSTERDAYGYNDSLGNYEDTHFGRACYIPMTMIPLSHQKNSDLQTQRLNRLNTQAAYYINGYQKDWFGFNQGALIGSFDGVTWFAIGTGRRVTSTSSKLFLAFNAPFLDLATKTDTVVNIIPDTSNNTAASVDYDPDLSLKDSSQGTAATCQKFHQCENDSECITQLGWEYVCADVSQYKTAWPIYNTAATELAGQENISTLFDILKSTISTTYTKRCVYRGAGAPCKRDYTNGFSNDTYKKLFTCAPNFYCASSTSTKFNDELVRSPNEMDNILYGYDANVLGRPLNYVTASKSLPAEVQSTISYNGVKSLGLTSTESQDLGMCRPGKSVTSNDISTPVAHMNADSNKRTDYISQIGGCNSSTTTATRVMNCPSLGSDLNYIDPDDDPTHLLAVEQNMCGGEARNSSGVSAFTSFEAASLLSLSSIQSPVLAQDACLRKAGSVCHTDLDCGPNIMHGAIASGLDLSYYGGTTAERNYWSESLICGQATATPTKSLTNYFTYSMTANRCCREIGNDFTMMTQGSKTLITDQNTTDASLVTSKFTHLDPKATNRYSRYSVSNTAQNDSDTIPKIQTTREPTENQWRVINETGNLTCCGGGWVRKFADGTHTWPVGNRLSIDSSNFSCLNYRSPLPDSTFPTSTAGKALFYKTSSDVSTSKYLSYNSYQKDYEFFCKYVSVNGCFQIPYQDSSNFTILAPQEYLAGDTVSDLYSSDSLSTTAASYSDLSGTIYSRMDTSPTVDPFASDYSLSAHRLSVDYPYPPTVYMYPSGIDQYDSNSYLFFGSQDTDYSVTFYLPAYIGWDGKDGTPSQTKNFIKHVYIKYFYSSGNPRIQDITDSVATASDCKAAADYSSPSDLPGDYLNGTSQATLSTSAKWCIGIGTKTSNRPVVIVRADTDSSGTYGAWSYAGVMIDFVPLEYHRKVAEGLGNYAEPGNPAYYLTKLGRLDLLGIPQITYEPLYCNNDQNKLVPGIFNTSITTRAQFTTSGLTYNTFDPISSYNDDDSSSVSENSGYGNYEKKFTYANQVNHDPVFSSHDFTCCTELGLEPKKGTAACCSGYSKTSGSKSICALPPGTDINVYFNKFVSSEGVGSSQPGGGLVAKYTLDTDSDGVDDISATEAEKNIDFNPFTGEPKHRDSTFQKLYYLGVAYCSSGKVQTGAAFGAFPEEPFSGSYSSGTSTSTITFITSIVDSILDYDTNNTTVGKIMFDQGYRWNHHYYCQ